MKSSFLRNGGRIAFNWFWVKVSACNRTCEIISLQSRRVMWGCFCCILLREQIGGLMYKWTLKDLWSERPCIVKCPIDAILCENWEGKIKGCDFVSEPQKFEFCVDLSTCQGVCLVSHPSFLVTHDLYLHSKK